MFESPFRGTSACLNLMCKAGADSQSTDDIPIGFETIVKQDKDFDMLCNAAGTLVVRNVASSLEWHISASMFVQSAVDPSRFISMLIYIYI